MFGKSVRDLNLGKKQFVFRRFHCVFVCFFFVETFGGSSRSSLDNADIENHGAGILMLT